MTDKEAIKYLIAPIATSTEPSAEYLKQKEAYELAIKALEEPARPQVDLISRSALKETITEPLNVNDAAKNDWYKGYYTAKNEDVYYIDNATTVEPETMRLALIDDIRQKQMSADKAFLQGYEKGYEKGKTEKPQDEWIPVSERLPEYSGLYLISVDDLVTVANFTGAYFMPAYLKVKAWQELPEPYKEGGEE